MIQDVRGIPLCFISLVSYSGSESLRRKWFGVISGLRFPKSERFVQETLLYLPSSSRVHSATGFYNKSTLQYCRTTSEETNLK